jgi:hypothetical protein
MGNRGVLHDEKGHIRRTWQGKRWIVCVLGFRGRKREVMTPNRYTELFFLDEATALAAGHRPCAECRRERFNAFRNAWRLKENLQPPTAAEIDNRLHTERLAPDKKKKVHLADLPNGVFVKMADGETMPIWSGTTGCSCGRQEGTRDERNARKTPRLRS